MNKHSSVRHVSTSDSADDTFYKMPKALLSSVGVVLNGQTHTLSNTEKNVYIVLATRITFFKMQYNNYCYDTQENIALLCGISTKQVGRILNRFIDLDILVAEKINPRKWVYRDISDLLVILPEGNKVNISKELFSSDKISFKRKDVVVEQKEKQTDRANQQHPANVEEKDISFADWLDDLESEELPF